MNPNLIANLTPLPSPFIPPKAAWTCSQTAKSFSLSELVAKAFGKECALAYEYLMNPGHQENYKICLRLENVFKVIETKTNCSILNDELPDDFDLFKKKLKKNIVDYFVNLDEKQENAKKLDLEIYQSYFSGFKCKLDYLKKLINKNINSFNSNNDIDLYNHITELKFEFKSVKNKMCLSENKIKVINESLEAKKIFKTFFHKLPDSTPIELRWRALDGLLESDAILSILDDLSSFLHLEENSLEPADVKRLNQIIIDLSFTSDCHLRKDLSLDQIKIELKRIAKKIHQKLLLYSEQKGISSGSVIIKGGFKRHFVLYQIKKNDLDTFDLSLINTGRGSITFNKQTDTKISRKSIDVVYSGLKIDELSKLFFFKLLTTKNSNSMSEVYHFLNQSLLKQSAKKIDGSERMLQKRGTCTIKPILELLKTELGEDLFRKLYLFMMERSLKSVEETAKTITPTALKLIFPVPPYEVATPEYYSDNLAKLIDAGRVALENKRIKYIEKCYEPSHNKTSFS